jgi:hypothetical protein
MEYGGAISEAGSDDLAFITSDVGYWRNRTAFPEMMVL